MKKYLFTLLVLFVFLFTGCAGIETAFENVTSRSPEEVGQLICDGSVIAGRDKQARLIFEQLDIYLQAFDGRELLVREAVDSAADLLEKTGVPADQEATRKIKSGIRLALKSRYVILTSDPAEKLAWFKKAIKASLDCLKE